LFISCSRRAFKYRFADMANLPHRALLEPAHVTRPLSTLLDYAIGNAVQNDLYLAYL